MKPVSDDYPSFFEQAVKKTIAIGKWDRPFYSRMHSNRMKEDWENYVKSLRVEGKKEELARAESIKVYLQGCTVVFERREK